MPLPAENQPISFQDINEELGNNSTAELDLESASESFGLTPPHGMNELAGLSFNTFTYGIAGVSGFDVQDDGTVTAPNASIGTIISRVYSSGYNSGTNKFPTVSTDTTRTVDVQVQAPPTGYSNNNQIVSGSESVVQGALETYTISTWVASGGAVSINSQTGVVSLTNNGDSTTTVTFTPSSFSTFTSPPASEPRNVSIGNITVPSNYFNTGQTVSGTISVTQLAFVAPAFTLSDWTGTISIDGQDGTISATAGNVSSVNIDTSTFATVSSSTPRTVQFDLIGIPSGYSNVGGNLNNQTQTVTQPAFVNPPSLSFTTSPTDWAYDETGVKTLTVTNTGGDLDDLRRFSLTGGGFFKLVSVDSNVPVINPYSNYYQATATSGTPSTFSVGVQPIGTNANSSANEATVSFVGSNDGGSQTLTFTATQLFQTVWTVSPSSLSFIQGGETKTITLNTSLSWTASVSGTGFSINRTSGTSGTQFINVTAASNSGAGRTGTVTISASGQTDHSISLSQAAADSNLDVSWNGGPNYEEGGDTSTLTLSNNSSQYREYNIYARQDYGSTVTWSINYGTSYAVWNTGSSTSTSDQTAQVGTTPVFKTLRVLTNSSSSDVQFQVEVTSTTSTDIYVRTYTHTGTGSGGGGGGIGEPQL
jgi:hypothetical protein